MKSTESASDREGEGGRSAGWLFGWGGGSEEVDAGVSLLDRCVRDPEGARELGWAGGWDSDAGAERVVRRRVVGSVGVVSG